jgi:uncharacterized protein YndB with AHSA1/START domain
VDSEEGKGSVPATPRQTDVIEHEVKVAARPETVFAYFTDPAKMVQWMGVDATLDPRPGGVCRIDPTGHGVMLGQYVEVAPYSRIVFTWGWETEFFSVPPQSTEVEVSFTPEGEATIVHLVHRRLPNAPAVAFQRAGWEHYLPRLAVAATGADPGQDPWWDLETATRAVRDAVAEAD